MTRTSSSIALLLPLTLALAAGTAFAADTPDVLVAEGTPMPHPRLLLGEDDSIAFAAAELGRERVVKGAPYCADAEQEAVQSLADGNRIVRKQTTRLCRDGDGRTRQEVERGGRRVVYLRDPAARESWVLDPERKTARRLGAHAMAHDASAWREYADRMRDWAKGFGEQARRDAALTPPVPPAPPTPPAPPAPVVVTEGDSRMHVLRMEAPHPPPPGSPAVAPLPPGVALRAQLGAPRGPGVANPLGTKDIEGVKANGERTTWTIEAGKVGNEKPIVITRDVWTSPDLMLTVLSRDADPRVGETIYRLVRIKRGEPDAALMRVPADYAAPMVPSGTGKG
jgi:hypothetical protein